MPKLLYLVTEDWFFVSHFLPMARTAKAAGFEVVVATRVRDHGARIAAEGFRVVALENERRSFGAFEALRGFFRMVRIVREERPDIVHCIALRMVVLGGLAARFGGAKRLVLAPTGLGHLWSNNGPIERVARALARFVVGHWLKGPDTRYLFENTDDPREFGLDPDKPPVTIVPGAGVDPDEFAPVAGACGAAGEGRGGGAHDRAEGHRRSRRGGAPRARARRAGRAASLWRARSVEPALLHRGRVARVVGRAGHRLARPYRMTSPPSGATNHVAMLLTWYREGVPRSLIEAAACGRPIVTTDAPGCRDLVRDRREGMLVPLRDSEAAARALVELASDADLRARLGAAARARFLERFTEAAVRASVASVYGSFRL